MKKYFHRDNTVTAILVRLKFGNIYEIKEFIGYNNRSPLWTPDGNQLVIPAGSTIGQGNDYYAVAGDWIVKIDNHNFVVMSTEQFEENYSMVEDKIYE